MIFPISLSLLVIIFSVVILFIIQRSQMLMSLLALEGVILSLTLPIIFFFPSILPLMLLPVLTMAVCGASIGLACLISSMRLHGSDMLSNLTLNSC